MSLSNPRLTNPAAKFIKWAGSIKKGKFYYYDANSPNEDKNVYYTKSIFIIILDQLHTITGFNKKLDTGIYSNEVRMIQEDLLTVKYFKKSEIIAKGLYSEIKDHITSKSIGAKYARSVYAALLSKVGDETKMELVNIQITGGALESWGFIKFKDDGTIYELSPADESCKRINGETEYYIPLIKSHPQKPELNEKAIVLDRKLQDYLNHYFDKNNLPTQIEREIEHKEEVIINEDNNYMGVPPPVAFEGLNVELANGDGLPF